MFDNPILFATLISIIVTLVYFFINKEKDKKDIDPGKNTKYLVVFGLVFIIGLIGKICYGCDSCKTLDNIEEKVEKILGGSIYSNVPSKVTGGSSNSIATIDASTSELPPF